MSRIPRAWALIPNLHPETQVNLYPLSASIEGKTLSRYSPSSNYCYCAIKTGFRGLSHRLHLSKLWNHSEMRLRRYRARSGRDELSCTVNVFKLLVESPCVSGVRGADLRRRMGRVMEECVSKMLDHGRTFLLGLAATQLLLLCRLPLAWYNVDQANAQTANLTQDLSGTWQGDAACGQGPAPGSQYLEDGHPAPTRRFSTASTRAEEAFPRTTTTLQESTVKIGITGIGATFEGKMSADGKSIVGNWNQGPNPVALTLERATPATEWVIPEPPPVIPPMAANANPSFEVATIKPSKPDAPGKLFGVNGRQFKTLNTTLSDLISFAYGVHAKQVVAHRPGPRQTSSNITAKPDGEGRTQPTAVEDDVAEAAGRAFPACISSRQEGAFGLRAEHGVKQGRSSSPKARATRTDCLGCSSAS